MFMVELYQQLAQALLHHPVVLATVVVVKGSVPREIGAKMIISSEGIFSTIGGGAGEAKVIDCAIAVLQTGENQLVEINLTGTPQRQTQGICGGIMQVWLERWDKHYLPIVHQILDCLKSGKSATIVTPFTSNSYLLDDSSTAPDNAFIETVQPPPTLLIIGAGHVGEQLAKVAYLTGFQIAIQDDRADWANPERYPQASMIFTQAIAAVLPQFTSHAHLYVALVTRGYQYDLEALTELLDRQIPCHYIGMIGSEKRVRQVYHAIEQTGISKDRLRSIYAPIGLDIGALTPEEIAVSITAELILVRRGGTGRPLSEALSEASRPYT
jgi:xanthine dehydrogenase accessory factor